SIGLPVGALVRQLEFALTKLVISLTEKAQNVEVFDWFCVATMIVLVQPAWASQWLALKLCPISCAGIVTRNGAIVSRSEMPYECAPSRQTTPVQAKPLGPLRFLPLHRWATSRLVAAKFALQ